MATINQPLSPEAQLAQNLKHIGAGQFTSQNYKPGTIKHIVLFRFKASITPAQTGQIADEFKELQQTCLRDGKPYIRSIIYGEQISGEGAARGFTLGAIVTFKSEGDRNYYVGEPIVSDPHFYDTAHHNFKKLISPMLDTQGTLVFDFCSSFKIT